MSQLEIPDFLTPKDPLLLKQAELEERRKEIRTIEAREEEIKNLLKDLQGKKDQVLAQGYKIRAEIEELEKKQRLEQAEKDKLALLRKEAEELEELLVTLTDLTLDLDAFSKLRDYQKEDIVVFLKAFMDKKKGVLN